MELTKETIYLLLGCLQGGKNARVEYERYSSQFQKNCFTEMRSGSDEGSYLRHIDGCITQL